MTYITTKKLCAALEQSRGKGRTAPEAIHDLIVESLSPQQRRIYNYVYLNPGAETSELSIMLKRPANHVGVLTKQLWDLGILDRTKALQGGKLKWYLAGFAGSRAERRK